jgi:hypothetical protein
VTAKKLALRALQLALVVLVTWGIVRTLAPDLAKVSWHDFRQYRPDPWRLAWSTLLLLAFYLLHAHLWRGIATRLGERTFGWRAAIYIYFVSGLGRYIPGKLWQIAGMALLAQRAGISAVAATAASLIAQSAFIATGLIYVMLVLPAWSGAAPLIIVLSALVLAVAAYRSRHWVSLKIGKLRPAVVMVDRVTALDALQWTMAYAFSWLILGAAFVLFCSAFVPLDLAQQRHVAGTVAAAYLGGLLAIFSVAGLGVREAVMGTLLLTVMPAPAALVVSVTSRIWFTIGELLPILLSKGDARLSHNSDV